MSDERIVEYLRSRGHATPPLDLVGSVVEAIADAPRQRHNWFAPFLPGIAAVGAAAIVVVAAMLVSQGSVGGPDPTESPPPISPASSSPAISPSPAVTPEPEPVSLLEPGAGIVIDAVDASGTWGSITIERGEDAGGYREVAAVDLDPETGDPADMYFENDPSVFYLEVSIEYLADRNPEPLTFGGRDWLLLTDAGELPPIEVEGVRVGLALHEDYPGPAIEVVGNSIGGDVRFAVPRELADSTLTLAYQPVGTAEAAWTGPVRSPGPAPDPVPTIVPPAPTTYVEQDGFAFSVIDHAGADALFATPDTCTNPVAGYTVTYPDDWYTNTEIGDVPGCSWFSPVFYEVDDPTEVPEEIAFVIRVDQSAAALTMGGQELPVPQVSGIDGRPVRRFEQIGVGGGFMDLGTFSYEYRIGLDGRFPDGDGPAPTLFADVKWALDRDPDVYTLHKAVLDRVMATIQFEN